MAREIINGTSVIIMEIVVITLKDLLQFKSEILEELKALMHKEGGLKESREWLKSSDVRELLKISPGTLQNLRMKGTLPYRKVGGSFYYRQEDIFKMLNKDG